ncbi:MAG TPA: type II toxin-antitoxin system prevent-host-death family antitoxin [Casimicrobiaceae bacterium]|nr:type II toxin-antitoxin system prevent-host-death family antitoxin [Casimicrobiaceae bacterium]
MDERNEEIGAYEAKTRFPELLRQVQAGKRFTITNRGKAVADLVPTARLKPDDPGAAIDKFRAFLKANPVKRKVDIKELVEDGRE